MDSDTLFLKKPKLIIDWIDNNPYHAIYTESGGDNITWKDEFLKKEFKDIRIIKRINSGLVCMDKNIMLNNIQMICKELINNKDFRAGINSGDQDIHRIILGINKSKPIPFEEYPVLEVVEDAKTYKDAVFKHYLFKFEAGIYEKDINKVLKELR